MSKGPKTLALREGRLTRPDGRHVAWVETGDLAGRPILRVPGTPGSRLGLRADQRVWVERRLRVIATERPGFGASSRNRDGTFVSHADDLASILDQLEIERLPIIGGSGAAPYVLAFAARHPERVTAATVVVGAAPVNDDEAGEMIGLNAETIRLGKANDYAGLVECLTPVREAVLANPVVAFQDAMDTAPPDDQAMMRDPDWQEMFAQGVREALRPGVEGWADESLLLVQGWQEIASLKIQTSLTWWHGEDDRNARLSAVQRLLTTIPQAKLNIWKNAGHLTAYREEPQILDELLKRSVTG